MAIRASSGTISNNTIDHVSYHAIEMTPSFGAREGAFVGSTVVSISLASASYCYYSHDIISQS